MIVMKVLQDEMPHTLDINDESVKSLSRATFKQTDKCVL